MGIKIVERDFIVLNELSKWKFCTARQIKILAKFSGLRTADRRLKKLIESNYVTRKYILYGFPPLYFPTPKAKLAFTLPLISEHIRVDKIRHEMLVVDTYIFLLKKYMINQESVLTERELKHEAGVDTQKHQPDFAFNAGGKKNCVEIELSRKKYLTLEKNVKANYLNFDTQIWILEDIFIKEKLQKLSEKYTNIKIIDLQEVTEYVKTL